MLPSSLDAIIIGAGAAGIAAARRLHDAGKEVVLLEASRRLGGRARTLQVDGMALDLGCGWLHSAERNPWVPLATPLGVTVDRAAPGWDSQWRDLGFPAAEHRQFGEAWDRWEARAFAALDGPDRPLSDFVPPDERWRPLLDAISGFANGAPLDRVSLHDWAAYEQAASENNWRVVEGYGTLVTALARGLPLRLDTRVTAVDHSAREILVETDRGRLRARAVILAVPTTVLAEGGIAFTPALPAKHEAAAALPLGLADKLFLRVEGEGLPENGHLIGNPHDPRTASHRLRPFGWPMVETFFGGTLAEELSAAGDGAAAAFAIDELAGLLGSDWRSRLTPVAATDWRREPHIGGSYSHARIGSAPSRAVLAEPVDGRLFFAGEACSREDFSTAHGAYLTGVEAAEAALAALGS